MTLEETIKRAQWLNAYNVGLTKDQCVDIALREMKMTAEDIASVGAMFGADINDIKQSVYNALNN